MKFGEIDRLYIYEFDETDKSFTALETRSVPGYSGIRYMSVDKEHTGCNGTGDGTGCRDEAYIISVARLISDCEYLLLQKIGMKPARVLLREGISVLEKGGNIDESLLSLSLYVAKNRRVRNKYADRSD